LINKINYDLDGLVSYIIQCLKNYDYLDVKTELQFNKIAKNYNNNLYGLDSFYNFKDSNNKIFLGKILSVAENGNLQIMKKNSKIKSYNFQEIQMILSN
jgi:biotin-(acetyl-CoA carboxylase) ligase